MKNPAPVPKGQPTGQDVDEAARRERNPAEYEEEAPKEKAEE